jgi:hypothetical protein
MSTPFVMTPEIEAQLADLRMLAESEERKLPVETLKVYSQGFDPEDPRTRTKSCYPLDQTLELPLGWKVTFSVEEQPFGWARHMSMSSPAKGRVPHPVAVEWTMKALGFVRQLGACFVYPEKYEHGRIAINVLEPLDPLHPFLREKDEKPS